MNVYIFTGKHFLFLNENIQISIYQGGATVWPFAGISVFPEKGSAIFWYNTMTDGQPDEFTMHSACSVLLGNKWIGNKWVGYNAQWNKKNCDISESKTFTSIPRYMQ